MGSSRVNFKVALGWWGCLTNGGETLGDLLAVTRLRNLLVKLGCDIELFSIHDYALPSGELVKKNDWTASCANSFDLFVFACGPLIFDSEHFQGILKHFESAKRVAIGVSVLPGTPESLLSKFAKILSRDGTDLNYGDLAFVPLAGPTNSGLNARTGICLRGAQREYGEAACLDEIAETIALEAIAHIGAPVRDLETRLYGEYQAPSQIFREFYNVDLIVSSRLHGCLHSLAMGTPFLAVDQIRNGAKVSSVLEQLQWPFVIRCSDSESRDRLDDFLRQLREDGFEKELKRSQSLLSKQVTLLNESIESLVIEYSRV